MNKSNLKQKFEKEIELLRQNLFNDNNNNNSEFANTTNKVSNNIYNLKRIAIKVLENQYNINHNNHNNDNDYESNSIKLNKLGNNLIPFNETTLINENLLNFLQNIWTFKINNSDKSNSCMIYDGFQFNIYNVKPYLNTKLFQIKYKCNNYNHNSFICKAKIWLLVKKSFLTKNLFNENNEFNKYIIKYQFQPKNHHDYCQDASKNLKINCICGSLLFKNISYNIYNNAEALCDGCDKVIKPYDLIWSCKKRNIKLHKQGYDLCLLCSSQHNIKIMNNNQNKQNDNNENNNIINNKDIWRCSRCTFFNSILSDKCPICSTINPYRKN